VDSSCGSAASAMESPAPTRSFSRYPRAASRSCAGTPVPLGYTLIAGTASWHTCPTLGKIQGSGVEAAPKLCELRAFGDARTQAAVAVLETGMCVAHMGLAECPRRF
jgi:hypothetical protein